MVKEHGAQMNTRINEWTHVVAIATDDGLKYQINIAPHWMDSERAGFSWGLPLAYKYDTAEEAEKDAAELIAPFLDALVKEHREIVNE